MNLDKILWVKFGWSDYYRGGPVDGNFGWLIEHKGKKKEGRGHEAFNFRPGPDGTYYCYVPPQSGEHAPWNPDNTGWTVVCLAKHPKHTGVHIVGWYEDATLHGEWLDPPKGVIAKREDASHPAYDWSYCITSKTAYFVPPELRTRPFSHTSIRQGKFSFLAGPDVDVTENKEEVLAQITERLADLVTIAVEDPSEETLPDPEVDPADPLKGFGTPEHRRRVELAAERTVIEHYEAKGYETTRVTHIPCGHDFVFTKGRSVRHVEVKGTASPVAQFFLTRNEHGKGYRADPAWRLAMVTCALTDDPRLTEYDARDLAKSFDLEPYVFLGKLIPTTEK